MYDQGLLTWQFPGMTDSVENISWSFIIIHLINRKTMIGGGGGGGGILLLFLVSLMHILMFFNPLKYSLSFILKFNKYKTVDHGRCHISFHIYTNQTLFDLPGLVYGLKSKSLILSAK